MSFDDDVDELKRELQTSKLDPGARKDAVAQLCDKLNQTIQSRRLAFVPDSSEDEPCVAINHTGTKELLATVFVNEDGSITFQSTLAGDDEDDEDDEEEDAGYFPPYVEYFDEAEFLEDVPEILKLGLAEYELDQEGNKNA